MKVCSNRGCVDFNCTFCSDCKRSIVTSVAGDAGDIDFAQNFIRMLRGRNNSTCAAASSEWEVRKNEMPV